MRQEEHVGQANQVFADGWFAFEDVKARAGNLARLERPCEGRFINHFTARRVDEIGFRLHQVEAA